jgi:hypothetical protein
VLVVFQVYYSSRRDPSSKCSNSMKVKNMKTNPPLRKQSHFKILLRTVIVMIFCTMFGVTLYYDLFHGIFQWYRGAITIILGMVVGSYLSRLVPMQIHEEAGCITLSFDRIYFSIILMLVIAKTITASLLHMKVLTDIIMCIIIGLMVGRLTGTYIRIRRIKTDPGFLLKSRLNTSS